jgi:hypothetical protein
VLLVRDPAAVLLSLSQVIGTPTLRDTGLDQQSRLLRHLQQLGQDPPVLDAARLLRDPSGVLSRCARASACPSRRRCSPGPPAPSPRTASGHRTGTRPCTAARGSSCPHPRADRRTLSPQLESVLAACQSHYERLVAHAL